MTSSSCSLTSVRDIQSFLRARTDNEADDDIDGLVARLEKTAPTLLPVLAPYVRDIKSTISFATASGVTRPILFNPLMTSNWLQYFKDGVCFQVVRRNKRSDILAAGGR